ncbi:hypothetical protein DMI80_01735 [Akkermansia muciniphila]|uniref:hypothetical protein n=2 Tax=Akkermansia muciniphila TaxID=239935 RepID=UPI00138E8B7E|nr:hypothetical protein [Akkermansia muciniphila]QHV64712.1 hypothetical protein DMI78_01730 [Akkermansia muciniphila]QHV67160.1 hypothetical protein DMI79_01725 [Akkermansia muciniphila]QHV69628.1 hypothetical protein DMI80_01735 [Akkermansia muciniphila]QHV72082.1 hypothetical protein DMI81_01735 [Akkermansia muciniphila]
MRQAANYNVHATESLPQSLALHFISPSGEDMDISGMTLRGAVVQDGVIMLDCAVTGVSTALVTWPRLAAGCGAYDIFLTDASGKEYPLLKGAVHVMSRVTPPDGTNEAAAVAGALDVSIPETEDGSVTIVENPSIVVEELVRQAEAARDEAEQLVETLEEQVESGELVNEAVANKLPGALKEAGVELAAATGQSSLSSGDAADTWTIVGGYAMTWGDEILAGHLPDSCRLKSISTVYFFETPAANQYCLRVWRLTDGAYSLIGTSAYVSNLSSGQTATWVFTPGVTLQRGDKIIIQVCEGTEMTPYALGMHAVLTPSVPGRGLITEVSNPPAVNGTMAPLMTVVVDYDDGITLGGIELATARQLDSLGRDVRQSSATAEAAARTAGQSAAAASTAASDAATSATSAANSATAAANALAAMPQVDASGNMTLAGGLTAAGAINANGGINVPLAVGAPTNESGVNRLYAAGLAAVTDAFSVRCYPLPANCSSSNGTVFKTDKEPNSLYFNVPPNSSFTVKCGLVTNARPMHNYSSIRGWVAPVRLPAVSAKFTARFGQMTTVVRMGRDRDAFTLVPDQAAGGYRIGEIIDITFDHVRDADAGGYHIRVREIYYSNAEQKWKMKTTQALAPEPSINSGYPVCVYAVVYEQYQDGGYDTEDRGALWLLHGGNSSRGCVKIATVKGVHCFESIYPFSGYYLDIENTNSWALAGAFLPATMHLHCNNVNPAYYGFSSMESNIIVSEAVEDFVDPEAETTTED